MADKKNSKQRATKKRMAQSMIHDDILASVAREQEDYTGLTGSSHQRLFSTTTPVQPDTWVPLNPRLARSYYDMFHRSWVVRTCFQEKIKAGFAGGFGYRYGIHNPSGRSKDSSSNKKVSRNGFEQREGEREGSTKGRTKKNKNTGVITESPDMAWIEEVLIKGVMYHDILGIVAFRRKVHPRTSYVRIEVVDVPKGFFIGKIDERGNQEYGWMFNKTVNTVAASGRRPRASEAGTASMDYVPDKEVMVYAWPMLEPDIGAAAPFKSIMSTVLLNLLEISEMWQNEIEGHYKMTHPTWITEPDIRTRGASDMIEQDFLMSVSGQLGPTESAEYFERSRMNAEISIHLSNNIRRMNEENMGKGQRKLGLKLDNTEVVHTRLHAWQDNHYLCPAGTKVGKGPDAKLRADMVNIVQLKAMQIAAVFGVPIPFFGGKSSMGGGGGSKTTLGSRIEGATFRNTLVLMRKRCTRFFEEAFMHAIGSLENSILAKMLTNLNDQDNEEEKMVRLYVHDILSPGGFLVLDEALTGKPAPLPSADIYESDTAPGKRRKKSKSVDEHEEGERVEPGERKIGAGLEAEELPKKMEQRKLFTTPDAVIQSQRIDYAGNVLIPDPIPATGGPKTRHVHSVKKKIKGKHTQGVGGQEYEQLKQSEKRKRDDDGLDPIQAHLEQWKGPHLRGQDAVLFEGYDREIQDFIDEQKYLDKLEEARWQMFMEKSNLMDRRVCRIMFMALQNFGAVLNPSKLQSALKQEMKRNPNLENTEHRGLSQDPVGAMEDVFVNEIVSQRKGCLNKLVDETDRITIVWNSAPLPDIELLISASKEGLGIPAPMVGQILANDMGLEDMYKEFLALEAIEDKKIEHYLIRKNLKVTSKTTGAEKKPSSSSSITSTSKSTSKTPAKKKAKTKSKK